MKIYIHEKLIALDVERSGLRNWNIHEQYKLIVTYNSMKLLFRTANLFALTSSILLLSSCTQYIYEVEITPCANIQNLPEKYKWTTMLIALEYTWSTDPYIKDKVVYMKNSNWKKQGWGDVCDFSYTRNPIE